MLGTVMAKSKGTNTLPDWASRVTGLRRQFKMSQGELARHLRCSAMTISRWERGQQPPTAHYYILLGNLVGKDDCWFFWEHAGLHESDLRRALPGAKSRGPVPAVSELKNARLVGGAEGSALQRQRVVAVPFLRAVAGTHGNQGDKKLSLDRIPYTKVMGTPIDWCPNPTYSSLIRVRGHSMEPLIHNGDILGVDSFQTETRELDGKIVVAAHEESGLCVSRLRRYESVDVLESENPEYEGIVLSKHSGWRILAKVLWWVSAAP